MLQASPRKTPVKMCWGPKLPDKATEACVSARLSCLSTRAARSRENVIEFLGAQGKKRKEKTIPIPLNRSRQVYKTWYQLFRPQLADTQLNGEGKSFSIAQCMKLFFFIFFFLYCRTLPLLQDSVKGLLSWCSPPTCVLWCILIPGAFEFSFCQQSRASDNELCSHSFHSDDEGVCFSIWKRTTAHSTLSSTVTSLIFQLGATCVQHQVRHQHEGICTWCPF